MWRSVGDGRLQGLPLTCDGQHTDATDRIWASESVTSVTAARLVGPVGNWEPKSPAEASKIAGLVVRAGTERTLDDEARASLFALLKDPKGFDDRIAKRCLMQNMIGFRITRTLATTRTEPKPQQLDLAIDTACSKIFVVRGDARRTVHASHYDPSRPAFLALVRVDVPKARASTSPSRFCITVTATRIWCGEARPTPTRTARPISDSRPVSTLRIERYDAPSPPSGGPRSRAWAGARAWAWPWRAPRSRR